MAAVTFEQFRDVLATAAGNACRCSRSALATTIASITSDSEIWTTIDLEAEWPGLSQEMQHTGATPTRPLPRYYLVFLFHYLFE